MSRNRFIQLVGLAGALGLSACARTPFEPRLGYCGSGDAPAESGCLEWVPETQPDTLIWEAVALTSTPASGRQGSVQAGGGTDRPHIQ